MVRISGVNLPRKKRIDIGLTNIFGIGRASAKKIVIEANIPFDKLCSDLTDSEIASIRSIVDENYQTEGDLRRFNFENVKRLKAIRCVKGRRHRANLPVRGQRTRTNARTRKGKKKKVR